LLKWNHEIITHFLAIISIILLFSLIPSYFSSLNLLKFVIFLGYTVFLIKESFFDRHESEYTGYLISLFILISFISLLGVIMLLLKIFNSFFIGVSCIGILSVVFSFYLKSRKIGNEKIFQSRDYLNIPRLFSFFQLFLFFGFLIFLLLSFGILIGARTEEIVRCIWNFVPTSFLFTYFFACLFFLFFLASHCGKIKIRSQVTVLLICITLLFLLTYLIFNIVLTTIYGGDAWRHIHRERLIDRSILENFIGDYWEGWGMYVLVVFFAKMAGVEIFLVHKWLIPLFASLFIPLFSYEITRFIKPDENDVSLFCAFSPLLLQGLTIWGAITTPDVLASIFLLASIYFWIRYLCHPKFRFFSLGLFMTMVSSLIHPGIGFFAIEGALIMIFRFFPKKRFQTKIGKIIYSVIIIVILSFLFPCTYMFLSLLIGDDLPALSFTAENIVFPNILKFLLGNDLLDFELPAKDYLLRNAPFIIIHFFGLTGVSITFAKIKEENKRNCIIFLLMLIIIYHISNSIITWGMKGLWGHRVSHLTALISFFFIGNGVCQIVKKAPIIMFRHAKPSSSLCMISKKNSFTLIIFLILSGLVTISTINAYNTTFPSISEFEVNAIRYIDLTTDEKYVIAGSPRILAMARAITRDPTVLRLGMTSPMETFWRILKNPENSDFYMLELIKTTNRSVAYFVISYRFNEEFLNNIVKILGTKLHLYAVFGDGKVYVFVMYKTDKVGRE